MKILIKLSGKIIDSKQELSKFISLLSKLYKKNKIVIVQGGGKQVNEWMQKLGLKPKFVNGFRYTDKKTLDIVLSVLSGLVNKTLVYNLVSRDIPVIGLSCIDGKLMITDIDKKLGFVGKNILEINDKLINLLLKNNFVVIISSVGLGIDKDKIKVVNINADTVMFGLAKKIKFDKLIFLTDVKGVLDEKGKVIKKLSCKEIDLLIKNGVVKNGMIAKLEAVKNILDTGVKSVVITDSLANKGTVVR